MLIPDEQKRRYDAAHEFGGEEGAKDAQESS